MLTCHGSHAKAPLPLHDAGIPKFYRWLSERYPLINQPGGATVAPIIDNFYLDMNGIIHNCKITGHPSGPKTEEEMILQIFTYLEKLVNLIQPQKVLFMAIDGASVQGGVVAWLRPENWCGASGSGGWVAPASPSPLPARPADRGAWPPTPRITWPRR